MEIYKNVSSETGNFQHSVTLVFKNFNVLLCNVRLTGLRVSKWYFNIMLWYLRTEFSFFIVFATFPVTFILK